jgi:hypothetical protein
MRARHTFRSKDLQVGEAHQVYVYGPESARAYALASASHAAIHERRERAYVAYRQLYRFLRSSGASLATVNRVIRSANPALWADLMPWRTLARDGYDLVRGAAERDTLIWSDAWDSDCPPPFTPCGSPREAHEYYKTVEHSAVENF